MSAFLMQSCLLAVSNSLRPISTHLPDLRSRRT
nr:MAG TPA: hypothetical protein [Caudoviricetes sp.]